MTTEGSTIAGPRRTTPDQTSLRKVLGHFCTGVAVITGHDGRRPIGFTCQSLTSVSLEPPYISFCPAVTSRSWPLIRAAGSICANILAAEQRDVCARFAVSGDDKFHGIGWRKAANGAPVLDGTLASIDAEIEVEHGAGDHTIVIARVAGFTAHEGRDPLLFFRGGYGAFSPAARD